MNEAWHEAGHAIAARLFGGEVRLVTLESDLDEHEGHVEVLWHEPDSAERSRRLAAVALAGPLAELAYRGELEDGDGDQETLSSWRGDWAEAEAHLGAAAPDAAARDELRRRLIHEVRQLFEDPAIYERTARLADALDAHGTLDATLLDDILG